MPAKLTMKYRCIGLEGFTTAPIDPSSCPTEVMNLYVSAITAAILFGNRIPDCSCRCDENKLLMVFESEADAVHVVPFIEREGRRVDRPQFAGNCLIIF